MALDDPLAGVVVGVPAGISVVGEHGEAVLLPAVAGQAIPLHLAEGIAQRILAKGGVPVFVIGVFVVAYHTCRIGFCAVL